MPTSLRVQKAVILAGGTGGRVEDLTHGRINKVNIPIHGKPMLAYQLEALRMEGIREVALIIRPDHERGFRELIESGKYPPLKYHLIHTPFQESGYQTGYMLPRVINSPEIQQFTGREPVFIGYGDTFYFQSYIKKAFARFRQRKIPIILSDPAVSVTEVPIKPELTVTPSSRYEGTAPAICGYIADPAFIAETLGSLSKAHRAVDLLRSADAKGRPSELLSGPTINLNTPINFIAIREVLGGKLRFPFPRGWTHRYKEELEAITNRRFLRGEHKVTQVTNRKRKRPTPKRHK